MPAVDIMPVNDLTSHATGNGPPANDYFKRAVYRPAPRRFNVEVLRPMKFGGSYSFGLRVEPVISDGASTKSGGVVEYEVWRKWEDCLWFQDMLELQYSGIAREKRSRLAAGKGVKKNGMYIHDRAASFDSLPPGPDPKSVSMNIHDYLPKLTKRGTLFRPSQATVEQRHQEFSALIEAFFQEDVPTLVNDLREDRIIRDFFGIWRRDHELAMKRNGKKARTTTIGGNTFSLYFSASNVDLPLPSGYPDVPTNIPPSPAVPQSATLPSGYRQSSRRRPHTADSNSSLSLSDADSPQRFRRPPSSAPPRIGAFRDGVDSDDDQTRRVTKRKGSGASALSISSSNLSGAGPSSPPGSSIAGPSSVVPSRRRANSRGPKPPSPRADGFDVAEDFPLFLSSSTRDIVQAAPRPAQPTPPRVAAASAIGGLEALPEDHELGVSPAVSASEDEAMLPPPTPRSRVNSNGNADRTHRNCIMFDEMLQDAESSSEGDMLEPGLKRLDTDTSVGETGLLTATSGSSRPSSVAISNLSLQSQRSSWRTSASIKVPRSRPSSVGSVMEFDFPFVSASGTPQTPHHIEHFQIALSSGEPRKHSFSVASSMSEYSTDLHRPSSPPLSPSAGANMDIRRSLSNGGRRRPRSHSTPQPLVPEQEVWSDLGDEFIDTYFGGPEPFFTPEDLALAPVDEPAAEDAPHPPDSPDVRPADALRPRGMEPAAVQHRRQEISMSLSSEQFPRPYQNRPPGQFHLPWAPSSPGLEVPPSPSPSEEVLVVKAALDDAIVVFRTRRGAPLEDVRRRVYDKFARQEGLPLSAAFTLAYVPPIVSGVRGERPRASTVSAGSADWARQVPIATAEEWQIAVASCGQKIMLRINPPLSDEV
ncbi:hypothetical protein FA95DRAFT_1553570 [Auriscalpium vulgare]|uniref:Uncharacterized protein n=1 Tax=Auriscalpium vulgare TaxID=40419 RepID=A0ACB8S7T0_9AGAM|nr:hypothetical protein FA95DRAFT_1553570 [Auriscalpium vulgare]